MSVSPGSPRSLAAFAWPPGPRGPEARIVAEVDEDVAPEGAILFEDHPAPAAGRRVLVKTLPTELGARAPSRPTGRQSTDPSTAMKPREPVRRPASSMNAGPQRSRASPSQRSISTMRHLPAMLVAAGPRSDRGTPRGVTARAPFRESSPQSRWAAPGRRPPPDTGGSRQVSRRPRPPSSWPSRPPRHRPR